MADISTIPSVRLQVAAARQEESGNGFARLPRSALSALGVTEGDVIEIEGKRSTTARVMAAYAEDEGLDVIRLDGLQRGNAEAGSGDHVQVRKAESRPAQRVVFAPAQKEMRLQGPGQALKRNFFGRALGRATSLPRPGSSRSATCRLKWPGCSTCPPLRLPRSA